MAQRKKRLCICSHHTSNLNFVFLSFCVYLFKNCPSHFLSHWESSVPVFSSKEHSSLPCKNRNKSLTLSYSVGNFEFPVWIEFYISVSSTGPPLIAATLVFFCSFVAKYFVLSQFSFSEFYYKYILSSRNVEYSMAIFTLGTIHILRNHCKMERGLLIAKSMENLLKD